MKKTVVATVKAGTEIRKIIEITGMGAPRFKIQSPKGRYLGKTSDGGYTSKQSAMTAAAR